MALNILHLSDLHIDNNTDSEDLAAKIHNAASDHGLSPNAIVVTGDIFKGEFFASVDYNKAIDKAVDFFNCLSSYFKINDFFDNIFFVPGNHEIYREAIKKERPKEKLCRYNEFLSKVYATEWTDFAENVYDQDYFCFVKHFIDEKVILIGLNSPQYKKKIDKEGFIETARIGNAQINKIHKLMRSINGYDDNRIIACLHNNIYNTLEYENAKNIDATCVQDNDSLLSMLSKYNCSLILNGHRHQQKNRRINLTQNIKEKDRLCTVIGGGKLTESFNYLKLYDKNSAFDLLCMEFRDDGGIYALSEEFKIPVLDNNLHFSKILTDSIQSDDKLNAEYKILKDSDINCDLQLIEMFECILGSLKELSNNFFQNSTSDINLLYIVLGTIHYRSNFKINDAFTEQSVKFIRKATDVFNLSDMAVQMLKVEDACALYREYEKYKNSIPFEHKRKLIFLALSIYLSDFFLTIKRHPNEFYLKYIQKKTNYKLDEGDIRTAISGNTIKFEVNEEHRALEITVRCSTANSHKVVSLIIKEFELILSKFEEDFAFVGFRIYYALPKLTKVDIADEKLESYEFGAYIPQLIPLLAGRNIYSEPEAFTRELIQNSIDAIKVMEKQKDKRIIDNQRIELEIGEDSKKGLKYFKITDHGTGMSRYVLERYLTTIGRSFYTSDDFNELKLDYSPISQFGIGFLSCFMVGKQVEIYTTFYNDLNETFFLDIPNFDGCFFIEPKNEKKDSPGSSITVWENKDGTSEEFSIEKIKKYIKKIIRNIPFDITLNNEMFIQKFDFYSDIKINTEKYNFLFFIPFSSNVNNNGDILVDENNIDQEFSEHGIYFYKKDKSLFSISENIVMNNGILVSKSHPDKEMREIHPYLDAVFNFPSNALKLDVSRDDIKNLNVFEPGKYKNILQAKIQDFLKKDSTKNIEYLFWCLLDHSKNKLSKINICCTPKNITIIIGKYSSSNELNEFCKILERMDKIVENFTKPTDRNNPYIHLEFGSIFHESISSYYDIKIRGILRYLDEYNGLLNINNFNEKKIIEFYDLLISYIIYNDDGLMTLQENKKFAERFIKEQSKLISILILLDDYEYYRNVPLIRSNNKDLKASIRNRSILILSILKLILSTIYSYSDLSKGISFSFDDKMIHEVLEEIMSKKS